MLLWDLSHLFDVCPHSKNQRYQNLSTVRDNVEHNNNANKNQAIWLKKCFLSLRIKVFKLLVFYFSLGFDSKMKDQWRTKAFWLVFAFPKDFLSFKLFSNITFRHKFEDFIQAVRTTAIDKFKDDWNNTLFKPSNNWQAV